MGARNSKTKTNEAIQVTSEETKIAYDVDDSRLETIHSILNALCKELEKVLHEPIEISYRNCQKDFEVIGDFNQRPKYSLVFHPNEHFNRVSDEEKRIATLDIDLVRTSLEGDYKSIQEIIDKISEEREKFLYTTLGRGNLIKIPYNQTKSVRDNEMYLWRCVSCNYFHYDQYYHLETENVCKGCSLKLYNPYNGFIVDKLIIYKCNNVSFGAFTRGITIYGRICPSRLP